MMKKKTQVETFPACVYVSERRQSWFYVTESVKELLLKLH